MARIGAVAGGVLGVLLAAVLPSVIDALSIFYSLLGVSLFVPVVAGLHLRRGGAAEGLAAVGGGVIGFLVARWQGWSGAWWSPGLIGLAISALLLLASLALLRSRPEAKPSTAGADREGE